MKYENLARYGDAAFLKSQRLGIRQKANTDSMSLVDIRIPLEVPNKFRSDEIYNFVGQA